MSLCKVKMSQSQPHSASFNTVIIQDYKILGRRQALAGHRQYPNLVKVNHYETYINIEQS